MIARSQAVELSRRPTVADLSHDVVFEAAGEAVRIVAPVTNVISMLRELGYEESTEQRVHVRETVYRVRPHPEDSEYPFVVERDGCVVLRASSEESVVRSLIAAVRGFLFEKKPGELHIHAGAASLNGRGILLPGESGSGKSTLTVALLLRGCQYLCDDLAIVQRHGYSVTPSSRPPSLRAAAYPLFPQFEEGLRARTCSRRPDLQPKALLPLDTLHHVRSARCPVGLIVFPSFRPGHQLCCQPMKKGTAAGKLLRLCYNLRWHTQEVLDSVVTIVQMSNSFALTFGDVHEAADWIVQAAHGSREDRHG